MTDNVEVFSGGQQVVLVEADIAQQVVLVEVEVVQGPPGAMGPAGPQLPPPLAQDVGKAALIRDLGAGPIWMEDFIHFDDVRQERTSRITINATGVAAPAPFGNGTLLQISSAAGQLTSAELDAFGAGTMFLGRRANGTPAAPTGTKLDDNLVSFGGRGFDSSNGFAGGAAATVTISATENWGAASHGAAINFATTPNGGAGLVTRWKVDQDGMLAPTAGGLYDLGSAALRVRNVFGGVADFSGALTAGGVGTFTPGVQITAVNQGGNFDGWRSNGTVAAPTAVKANDILVAFTGKGRGASVWSSSQAAIAMKAASDWTDASMGTALYFSTTANGSTALTDRWAIGYNGWLVPMAGNTYDIGLNTQPVRNGFFGTLLSVNAASPTPPPAPIDAAVLLQLTGGAGALAGVRVELNGYAGAPQFNGRRANGTLAAPTPTLSGDSLAIFGGRGWSPAGFSSANRATVGLFATEDFTDTAQGTMIRFDTTPNGTVGVIPRWQIQPDGNLLPLTPGALSLGVPTFPLYTGWFTQSLAVNRNGASGAFGAPLTANAATLRLEGGPGESAFAELSSYGGYPGLVGRNANGSAAAPAAISVSQVLLSLDGRGYGATGWSGQQAAIMFASTEAWTDAAHGSNILFGTTPNGTAAQVLSWQLSHNGAFAPLVDAHFDIGSPVARVGHIYSLNADIPGNLLAGTIWFGDGAQQGLLRANHADNNSVVVLNNTNGDYFIDDWVSHQLTWVMGGQPKWWVNALGDTQAGRDVRVGRLITWGDTNAVPMLRPTGAGLDVVDGAQQNFQHLRAGDITAMGALKVGAGERTYVDTDGSSFARMMFDATGGSYVIYSMNTHKFVFVSQNVVVASIDGAGNMVCKGAITPNGTPGL